MNSEDVLQYGHLTVMQSVHGLEAGQWDVPGVCGVWSVREIVAHLASFEAILSEVLRSLEDPDADAPTLKRFREDHQRFNDEEVAKRSRLDAGEVLQEYQEAQARNAELVAGIPLTRRRKNGLLPWYGAEYDLEDLLVYSFYGHKREHCAQINVYRDTLE